MSDHATHLPDPDTIRARATGPLIVAVDRFAQSWGLTRSEAVRILLFRGLESYGCWPPVGSAPAAKFIDPSFDDLAGSSEHRPSGVSR